MTQKIAINRSYGGFNPSLEARELYKTKGGEVEYHLDIPRDCPILIETIETLGTKANGEYSKLKIVEIPDGIGWGIEEYDGMERVSEERGTWM